MVKKKTPAKTAKSGSAKRDARKSVERRPSQKVAEASKSAARKPAATAAKQAATKPVAKPIAKAPMKPAPAPAKKSAETVKTAAATPAGTKPATPPMAKAHVAPAAAKTVPNAKSMAPLVAAGARPNAAPRAMPAALSKPAASRLTAPAPAAAAPKAITPKQVAERAAAARQQQLAAAASKKPVNQRHGFKTNEFIVYPAHGVGRIVGIEEQEIAGISLELFVIQFEKDKMTLRVPTGKSQSVGMRKLSDDSIVKRAMDTLKGKARIKRTMWSRRAQEYEAKINSGDLIAIAEVVRDLYRSETQPEQSYSERQLYEAALDRMAREIAAVDKLDERGAMQRITEVLSKSAKGRRVSEEASAEVKAA